MITHIHELYKKYSQLQTDFNRLLIEKETGKNTLNKYEKEKYIEFENLLKIRDELEENWRTELTKNSIKSKSVWELHYKMLLLSSYTLTPCVRTELMIAKFATKEEDMSENIDYVYIPENIEEDSNRQKEVNDLDLIRNVFPRSSENLGYLHDDEVDKSTDKKGRKHSVVRIRFSLFDVWEANVGPEPEDDQLEQFN